MNEKTKVMVELYRSGKLLSEIGEQFGITKERVRQRIKDYISSKEGGDFIAAKQRQEKIKAKKLKKDIERFGCSYEEKQLIPNNLRIAFTCKSKLWKKDKSTTFNITLKEWYDLWVASGYLNKRGRGKGSYVMVRIDKIKPYQIDNMHIIPLEQSSHETIMKTHARRKNIS